MSEHDWKPGDVAMVNGRVCIRRALDWEHGLPDKYPFDTRREVEDIRPLLVIDPEDREQVERLTGALVLTGAGRNDENHWPEVQAALRAMLAPPKPKCSAHGNEECGDCSRIAETNLAAGECCHCESYGKTGMHWDTCQGRIRGLIFGSREAAAAWIGDVS